MVNKDKSKQNNDYFLKFGAAKRFYRLCMHFFSYLHFLSILTYCEPSINIGNKISWIGLGYGILFSCCGNFGWICHFDSYCCAWWLLLHSVLDKIILWWWCMYFSSILTIKSVTSSCCLCSSSMVSLIVPDSLFSCSFCKLIVFSYFLIL